jgi:alanine racemase
MIKAEAYGHGIENTARTLESLCECFGVARFEEALAVRKAAAVPDILVCGEFESKNAPEAARNNITLTVSGMQELIEYRKELREANKPLKLHIKIDSGMNRLGVKSDEELLRMLEYTKRCGKIILSGIYTHFADCRDSEFTKNQYDYFIRSVSVAKALFPHITAHCASSAAVFTDKKYHMDMVRPGINIYGFNRGKALNCEVELLPAIKAYSSVIAVKRAEKGETIGYDRVYKAEKALYYAVISAGYGDGIKRALSREWTVYIKGYPCHIAGNICMDTFMAVLPEEAEKNIKSGDKVVIFSDEGESTFENCAAVCNTITYEILTSFTGRAKRIYI